MDPGSIGEGSNGPSGCLRLSLVDKTFKSQANSRTLRPWAFSIQGAGDGSRLLATPRVAQYMPTGAIQSPSSVEIPSSRGGTIAIRIITIRMSGLFLLGQPLLLGGKRTVIPVVRGRCAFGLGMEWLRFPCSWGTGSTRERKSARKLGGRRVAGVNFGPASGVRGFS